MFDFGSESSIVVQMTGIGKDEENAEWGRRNGLLHHFAIGLGELDGRPRISPRPLEDRMTPVLSAGLDSASAPVHDDALVDPNGRSPHQAHSASHGDSAASISSGES